MNTNTHGRNQLMEPIIVTAFWDVGRGENCAIPRSNKKYYEEFKLWARIRNYMIIYTDNRSEKVILDIRKKYGLEDKTKVIVCPDIFDIEHEIYEKMQKIEKQKVTCKFSVNAMSNRANFDYAWFMKYWCINDAANYIPHESIIAWMDFGFNHVNVCYSNMDEFDFVWDCNVATDKIHIFTLKDIHEFDDKSLLDTIIFQQDIVMGVFHIVPVKLAGELWRLIKNAMNALLAIKCLDDDQMLLLIAYYSRPDLFNVHVSDWFLPLKEMGAEHLTVIEKNNNAKQKTIKQYFRDKRQYFKNKKQRLDFLFRIGKRMRECRGDHN